MLSVHHLINDFLCSRIVVIASSSDSWADTTACPPDECSLIRHVRREAELEIFRVLGLVVTRLGVACHADVSRILIIVVDVCISVAVGILRAFRPPDLKLAIVVLI